MLIFASKKSINARNRNEFLTRKEALILFKIIRVDPLEGKCACCGDADIMLDHQLCQSVTINGNDLLRDTSRMVGGILAKVTCSSYLL